MSVGGHNVAEGIGSSVSGGYKNTAFNPVVYFNGGVTVSGGTFNTASGNGASVSGGTGNTASGYTASISGGSANTASGNSASVSGGNQRSAPGSQDWRAGDLFQDD